MSDFSGREITLEGQLLKLGIRQEDIIESFVRSGGPGGQNVNKTSTCVYLKHLPTGIEVKCQQERAQAQNRILARQILIKKIIQFRKTAQLKKQQEQERLRRQNRRRSRAAKLKMLEEKRRRKEKKLGRKKIKNFTE